ncbi:MAG: phosphoenolpyruvate--protein phosphotransferase [Rubrimonas sp.]|uniref:phosphoenolpyruvate--protein phosphotransferase n=1 Tax=Rubrimonas sp. TaxID=2036015 RepID=UPI002FDC96F7
MTPTAGVGSRALLRRLRQVMAEPGDGQQRLDKITAIIATNMVAEVCSIYLRRDARTLELCATEGLRKDAVHKAKLRIGEGLVGQIAARAEPLSTDDAPNAPGFQYLPETGEDIYRSFCGVPIQRLGKILGVLVVQNTARRAYAEDEIDALEVVAMVIAEMAESGALTAGRGIDLAHRGPHVTRAVGAAEGAAIGPAHLHEPKVVILNPIVDDVEAERTRLRGAMDQLREEVDRLLETDVLKAGGEHRDVLETYRMFAHDKGWLRRLDEAVSSGVIAEVAVERVQSAARARMDRVADPYLRERLHDLDDLANRLLRLLTGADNTPPPEGSILIGRSVGPGELLEFGGRIKGVALEEGSAGGHAAIVARALGIPLVVQAHGIVAEAESGDRVILDGEEGAVFLRPEPSVLDAFEEKLAQEAEARKLYRALRRQPARTRDGVEISLHMNAGLVSDMGRLEESGADGVGLYRTELMFMIRATMPGRDAQADIYRRILDAADGKRVAFRTLDIGSDKILPYLKRHEEENPAMGWRALRFGLDRPWLMKMQLQALLRGAGHRKLTVMFPFVSEPAEFRAARELLLRERDRLAAAGKPAPEHLEIGAMLETPSLAYAPDSFFRDVDFLSVGGNDLKQFFFAADRGNERVRRRYDPLSTSWLRFLGDVVARCEALGAPLSFCGEAAGRPLEALALAAVGFRTLSVRASAIGPVKRLLRSVDMREARAVVRAAIAAEDASARGRLTDWARAAGAPL